MTSSVRPENPGRLVKVPDGQGVQVGDHNEQRNQFVQNYFDYRRMSAEPAVRSAYLEQVRRIAPPEPPGLVGREAELAAFSSDPGQGPYVWWRASAWAGKSALMSWFVLHPPPGVQVVSFFVTARWKGQDDRNAFINAVLEQLADLLGQPIPAYLTETTRELHLLRMLTEAAEECQRLILVVDGLDEDRGASTEPDAHSIAALLPARPVPGLRVIAAGRCDPPIPADVQDGHPLRDPAIVRVLDSSRWAEVVRSDMQRELRQLLHGDQVQQDRGGRGAAAGGGLSAGDLAELTCLPAYEIEENLHAVAGRTFSSRASVWQPRTAPPVYVLAHEELQATASAYLGQARLEQYRERLHSWAEKYYQGGWPAGTPEYLLRGYFRLLYQAGDIPRLLACATDQGRHDRMLDITGADSAALTEITDAQNLLLRRGEPDLPTLASLNAHLGIIADRNAHVPAALPAVWASIGYPERAEALARVLTDSGQRAQALAGVVRTVAGAGDLDRAAALAEQAEAAARAIADPGRRAQALADVARAAAAVDLNQAEALAEAIADPGQRALVLAQVAQVAGAGDLDRATVLAEQARVLARAIADPDRRARVLADLAQAAAGAGDLDRAAALAEQAEEAAWVIPDFLSRVRVLADLTRAAGAGDLDRAEALARTITDKDWQAQSATRGALRAWDILNTGWQAWALASVARAATWAGDLDRARALAEQAEAAAQAVTYPAPERQAQVLTELARAAAALGDLDRAEATARAITRLDRRAPTLADLAQVAAGAGDLDRAAALAGQAEATARAIIDPGRQAQVLT
jgi:hypothetical protein